MGDKPMKQWVMWLLQILEQAAIAEVIDVSTKEDQLGVHVWGHTVVGGQAMLQSRWHQWGSTAAEPLTLLLHQGTETTILCQWKNIAFVFNTGHTVHILVSRRKHLILTVDIRIASSLCVFWAVVPKQAHHQLPWVRILPQRRHFGHIRQTLLPWARLEEDSVSNLDHIPVPLHCLKTSPWHKCLFTHREHLPLKGWTNWLPSIGAFMPPLVRDRASYVGSRGCASSALDGSCVQVGVSGSLGTLRTLASQRQSGSWLVWLRGRGLNVLSWLFARRHRRDRAGSADSRTRRRGEGWGAVQVTQGWAVLFFLNSVVALGAACGWNHTGVGLVTTDGTRVKAGLHWGAAVDGVRDPWGTWALSPQQLGPLCAVGVHMVLWGVRGVAQMEVISGETSVWVSAEGLEVVMMVVMVEHTGQWAILSLERLVLEEEGQAVAVLYTLLLSAAVAGWHLALQLLLFHLQRKAQSGGFLHRGF